MGPPDDGREPRRLRVVQWTTGTAGSAAVRGVIDHPRLELVGCYAWSPDKVGRDVGELCGLDPVGIAATDDVAALLALAPDCVVYTPFRPDIDHVERILAAGVDVVTTLFMLSGTGYGDRAALRVAEACASGSSSLYAGGVYPGQVPNVALAASAMCRRVDRLSVLESLDVRGYANEAMFRAMGFDLELDDPRALDAVEAACGSFREQVSTLAAALGAPLDDVVFSAELAAADADTDLGFMTLGAGRVAGFRGTVAGLVGGRRVVECRFVWKLGEATTPSWPVTDGYVIEIEGDPGVRVKVEGLGAHLDGATTTAMAVVNAIPAVCAAGPGIVRPVDLPLVAGTVVGR